jgi:nitroreductase
MKKVFVLISMFMVLFQGVAQCALTKDALTVIYNRKSVRNYIDKPVSKESLEILLKAGMAAPTAADKRPWSFVVITDKAKLNVLATALPHARMLTQAAAAIIVCGTPSQSLPGADAAYWIQDCSAATENILLAAEAIGLGAVWTGVYPNDDRVHAVRTAMSIPEDTIPLNVIPIGYPVGIEQPKNKYNAQKIHWNSW